MASSTARQGAYSTQLQRERCARGWRKQQVIDCSSLRLTNAAMPGAEIQLLELWGIACRAHGGSCVVRP